MKQSHHVWPVLIVLLACSVVHADPCVDYGQLSQVPLVTEQVYGASGGTEAMVASGDHLYYVAGGTLEVVDLSDPTVIAHVAYSPTINLGFTPQRLVKIGRDYVYAIGSTSAAVIDIRVPQSPTLASTVASFGTACYLGWSGSYGFFLDGNDEIDAYDISIPSQPSFATSFTVPSGGAQTARVGAVDGGRLFLFGDGVFLIYDVSQPQSPVLLYQGSSISPEVLYDTRPPCVVAGNQVFVGGANSAGDHTFVYDVTDPTAPAEVGFVGETTIEAAPNGVTYGWYYPTNPYGLYFIVMAGNGFLRDIAMTRTPMVATDTAIAYFGGYGGLTDLYVSPRQCDGPQIVADSVEVTMSLDQMLRLRVTATWETPGVTDPDLDRLTIRDHPRTPPQYQLGNQTVNGGEDLVWTGSAWKHEVSFTFPDCYPKTKYYLDVASVRTGLVAADEGHAFQTPLCVSNPPQTAVGGLSVSPNPFNPQTTFTFAVPADARSARLTIYGVDGRLVRTLHVGATPGEYSLTWRGRDDDGRPVSSGVFFARLVIDEQVYDHKISLLK